MDLVEEMPMLCIYFWHMDLVEEMPLVLHSAYTIHSVTWSPYLIVLIGMKTLSKTMAMYNNEILIC